MKNASHKLRLSSLAATLFCLAVCMAAASAVGAEDGLALFARRGQNHARLGKPHADQSVDGHALTIGGTTYEKGLGTHTVSIVYVDLKGDCTRFSAKVGVDDEVKGQPSSIQFSVIGDDRELWKGDVMKSGQAAVAVDVDVRASKRWSSWWTTAATASLTTMPTGPTPKFEVAGRKAGDCFTAAGRSSDPDAQSAGRAAHQRAEGFWRAAGPSVSVHIAATGDRPMDVRGRRLARG